MSSSKDESSAGGRSGAGHSHGGHSHGGHSHGSIPGHGVAVEDGFVAAERPDGSLRPPLRRGDGRGKTLFVDMQSGIAGDMTVAGLIDLGVPESVVTDSVSALGLEGVSLKVESGYAGAIGATHLQVNWPTQERERNFDEIRALIVGSKLSDPVKNLSVRIFERLAQAEADVHRTTLDQVHFHEVGAIDAIVDIVGAAAGFEFLGAEVKASPVPLGRGFVHCRHGRLPLPAPATLNCLKGVPTVDSGLDVELVTPTGAAIIGTVAIDFGEWFPFSPERIGWGAGTRGLPDRPNALRMILGREASQGLRLTHALLETNLDDMTGELASHALTRLFEEGALDVWIAPVTMKKGRPGMVLSVLCERNQVGRLSDVILQETSSIGVRQSLVARKELSRKVEQIETPWGTVRFKESALGSEAGKVKPEFDDCRRIAQQENIPLRRVLLAVEKILSDRRGDGAA